MIPIKFTYLGVIASFFLTFISLKLAFDALPRDRGKDFVADGNLSKGKPTGAGIIFVLCSILCSVLFIPFNTELFIYLAILLLTMLTGFIDDKLTSVNKPLGRLVKGTADLLLCVSTAATFVLNNDNLFNLPWYIYVILATIMLWVSVNVTNCTDGVDGLSGSLAIVSLSTLYIFFTALNQQHNTYGYVSLFFIGSLLAYLWYNANPSLLIMGDAGSRAIGLLIGIVCLKTYFPLIFIPASFMFLADGGLSLVKITLKRLGFDIKKITVRAPVHDHMKVKYTWKPPQIVARFVIIQVIVSFLLLAAVYKI